MKKSFEKWALLFAFLLLILVIAGITGFNIESFRQDYRSSVLLRSLELAKGLEIDMEKDLSHGTSLGDLTGINARCRKIVGTDPEIVYCLIEDARRVPVFCSDPSFHSVAGAKLISSLDRSTSLLNLPALGDVFDVSTPIFSAGHHLVGRIRLGVPASAFSTHFTKLIVRSFAILGLVFLFAFSLVVLFFRRDVFGPTQQLRLVAKAIASGDFDVDVPGMLSRDFADLGRAFQEIALSLKEREEKIQGTCHELEETNLLLQQSYETQERINTDLKRSREMYRALFDHASDAMVVSDQNDRITLFNKRAEEFFGIPGEQVVGGSLFRLIEEAHGDLDLHYRLYRELLDRGYLETELHYLRAHDRRAVAGWLRASVVRGPGGTFWVQAIFRDVAREGEIQEHPGGSTRELEGLNRMKDSFLGMASHELKTPLTVILGYSDLILAERASALEPGVLEMVRHISHAAERLSDIVRDMLDVSMLDAKRVSLKKRSFQINDLIRNVILEVEACFRQREQVLEMNLDPDLPQSLFDPDRMTQVMKHLVSNAVKFTPNGGTIVVETRAVTLLRPYAVDPEGHWGVRAIDPQPHPYVEITVRDTGIGIAEKDQVLIFDKFFEAGSIEEHFTEKVAFNGKGTGLGLAIVKGIVELHGGEVWVESSGPDARQCPGSTFYVLLPMTKD